MIQKMCIGTTRWDNHAFTLMGLVLSIVLGVAIGIVAAQLLTPAFGVVVGIGFLVTTYIFTVLGIKTVGRG